ncbi:MAG: Stk1 family PASTA domain-containing Ser/Thr kinase [Pseudonocardiales bacterium]|nr:MAG: Stk1 family PASTA domain-containing Ser/Thr kinase [Pseudonocardiales bacterium]
MVGSVLEGRYRIEGLLAHGGMSSVYAGTDLRLDRTVAIKVMAPSLAHDPAFVRRFEQEARTAARLSHVNVVAVHDQGEDLGRVFLVMELVRGRTLRDLLREHGRLSPELAVAVMEPMLAALGTAHRAGLIHRDVKPENVLLSDDGLVKVADFGLARAVAQAEMGPTATNLAMGTVAYVAPEQVARRATDARTDVYSAGVVLYEMLTGVPPFHGESAVSIAYQHVHSDIAPPIHRVRGMPAALSDLTVRATRRDPRARPQNAGAFLAELFDVRQAAQLRRVPIPPRLRQATRTQATRPQGAPPRPTGPATTWRTSRGATATRGTQSRPRSADAPAYTAVRAVAPTAVSTGPRTRSPSGTARVPAPSGPRPPAAALRARPPDRSAAVRAEERRRRRHRFLAAVIVILLLATAAAVGGWWLGSGRFTTVPQLTRMKPVQATALARSAHLHLRVSDAPAYSDSVPAGQVVASDPGAGTRLTRGATVGVRVSSGTRPVPVPDVVGKSLSSATSVIAGSRLRISPARAFDEQVAVGVVISQRPTHGAVAPGSAISVVVSKGPHLVAVPDVRGRTLPDATAAVLNADLNINSTSGFSIAVTPGAVISQRPASGAVRLGTTVYVVVSQGPDLVTVPRVVGMSASEADSTLRAAGLVAVHRWIFIPLRGVVVSQRTDAGSAVARGSRVVVVLV